jgi:type VI protein secretion system component Hcp
MQESLPTGSAAAPAADIFLHVKTKRAGKIKGEASAPEHVDDIVVCAWNWGLSAGSAMGPARPPRAAPTSTSRCSRGSTARAPRS